MGFFDDYPDAAPRAKRMRGGVITTFLLHVYQCITINQNKIVTATLISKVSLKPLYSSLVLKVIKYSTTSPNFEKACKIFHYESGKSKALQKQTIGLKFYLTIQQCVTILHYNRINFNENIDVFKDLNEFPPSDDWFPYEHIDYKVNKKLDKTEVQLAGDEMEKETKNYVKYLYQDSNWLKIITI